MAGDFQAGSVSLELRAQTEQLSASMDVGKKAVQSFGQTVQATAAQINSGGTRIGAQFDDISNRSVRMVDRFGRVAAGLIATQIALESLTKSKGLSSLQIEIEAGARAFQTLFAVMSFMPTPVGAVLATIAALIRGYNELTRAIDEVEKAQISLNQKLAKHTEGVLATLAKGDVKEQTAPEAQAALIARISQLTAQLEQADLASRRLAVAEAELASQGSALEASLSEVNRDWKELSEALARSDAPSLQAKVRVRDLADESDRLESKLQALRNAVQSAAVDLTNGVAIQETAARIRNLKEALDFAKTADSAKKFAATLQDVRAAGEASVELGIRTPLQAAQIDLNATREAVERLIKAQLDLQKAASLAGLDDELRTSLLARANEMNEEITGLSAQAQQREALVRSKEAAANFASGLSTSIGSAVTNGILQGKSAMATLADVGQSLFSNFLQKSVDTFEKGMVDAFQSIAGQGGEILGGALTAVLGVLGAIFAKRKGSGNQSFASIQSQVTSSEAVRGIVAGPTNVAIAAVGDDLVRAMRPTVERLDSMIRILTSIDFKTGRAGALGFSAPAVTVPTA